MMLILMTVLMMMRTVRKIWMDIGDFKNGELQYMFPLKLLDLCSLSKDKLGCYLVYRQLYSKTSAISCKSTSHFRVILST